MDNHQKNLFQNILQELPLGVYFVDLDRRITFWNHSAEVITGFSSKELVGTRCPDGLLQHIDHKGINLCENGCPLSETLKTLEPNTTDIFLHHKNGQRVPVLVRSNPIFNAEGDCIGAVEVFEDNTPRIAVLDRISELQEQAYLDPLTGLANRRYAEQQLENAAAEMDRLNWNLGIIALDIDDFKHVNDTYGHQVGDKVLRMVANALRSGSRSFDFLARWGGEEFLCVAININAEQLDVIAERLRVLVEESFFMHAGERIAVTLSGGAIMHKPGNSLKMLLRDADNLLYASKTAGKNRISRG